MKQNKCWCILVRLYLARIVFGALKRNSWTTVFLLDTTMLRTERDVARLYRALGLGSNLGRRAALRVPGGRWLAGPRQRAASPDQPRSQIKISYDCTAMKSANSSSWWIIVSFCFIGAVIAPRSNTQRQARSSRRAGPQNRASPEQKRVFSELERAKCLQVNVYYR